MAKIDTSKIEGYSNMTAEEKLAALEAFTIPDADYSGYVKKDQFDKTASELAALKKTHNAMLSEEERKKAAENEELTNIKQELETLRQEKLENEHKAKFLALGYEEALATETAKALAAGDMAKVFANQKTFLEAHDKSVKAGVMKGSPTPPPGGGSGDNNYQKFIDEAMSRGDMATAAAYMRKAQEEIMTK